MVSVLCLGMPWRPSSDRSKFEQIWFDFYLFQAPTIASNGSLHFSESNAIGIMYGDAFIWAKDHIDMRKRFDYALSSICCTNVGFPTLHTYMYTCAVACVTPRWVVLRLQGLTLAHFVPLPFTDARRSLSNKWKHRLRQRFYYQ